MEQNKNIWIIVFVVLALLLLFGSFFGTRGYGMMRYGIGFGWPFMMVFMILCVGGLIWFFGTPSGHCMTHNHHGSSDEDALTILKKRYASGEISRKEYEEMRKELNR